MSNYLVTMENPTLQERFSSALHGSARAWRVALDNRIKYLGVSQAGWMAIAMIAKSKTALSQSDLAQQLSVEGPTMVAMIDRLVKAGFVKRLPSETDRRVNHIALTETGQALYGEVKAVADDFRQDMLKRVDAPTLRLITEFLEALQADIE